MQKAQKPYLQVYLCCDGRWSNASALHEPMAIFTSWLRTGGKSLILECLEKHWVLDDHTIRWQYQASACLLVVLQVFLNEPQL